MAGKETLLLFVMPLLVASIIAAFRNQRQVYWRIMAGLVALSTLASFLLQFGEPMVNGPFVILLTFVTLPIVAAFLGATHPVVRESAVLSFVIAVIAYPVGIWVALAVGVNAGYLSL